MNQDQAELIHGMIERGEIKTRVQCAQWYRSLLHDGHVDVSALNGAIAKRWSIAGLNYIKKMAWKGGV